MKYLLPLILFTLMLPVSASEYENNTIMGEQFPDEIEKTVATLDKDLKKAFAKFLKGVDKAIKKAEKTGDVGLAASLSTSKQYILKARHFQDLGEAAEKDEVVAVTVSSKWLKKEFNATKSKVNKRGVVTLFYDFTSPREASDFSFSDTEVHIKKGMLSIGAQIVGKHRAKWDGSITVKMESSYANRKGTYLTVGNTVITGSNYNAWFIKLNKNEAKFSSDYTNSGSLTDYRTLEYKMTSGRSLLSYGAFKGEPVTVGAAGGSLRGGFISIGGANGGANIKSITITGTLNMDAYLED